jgi:hypothetical protein
MKQHVISMGKRLAHGMTKLNMRGSLVAKTKSELPSHKRNFIHRIRQDYPFLVSLDVADNPAIEGSTDDFLGLKYLEELHVQGCTIEGRFGGPLEISIDASSQRPIDNHAMCFDLSGTNNLQLEIEDSKFNYEHCYCDVGCYGHPPACMSCLDHAICKNKDAEKEGLDYNVNGWIAAEKGYWATPSCSHADMKSGNFPTHVIECRGIGTDDSPW